MTSQTLLLTLSGTDRPGVTKTLFAALAAHPITVLDVEQLVVRGRLVLSALVNVETSGTGNDEIMSRIRQDIRSTAAALEMDVTTVPGALEDTVRRRDRVHVTILGAPLRPDAVSRIAEEIANRGGNIDRIRRIASYPVTAVVFEGSGAELHDLRRALVAAAAEVGVDIAVQESGLDRRGQHLVVIDVDSTLIQNEVIDLIAEHAGVGEQVAQITEQAMAGDLDFVAALRARVALLKGLPVSVLDEVRTRLRLTPGARTLCRTLNTLGYRVCLVSGGFAEVIMPIADELGIDDVRANHLGVRDGFLTGEVVGVIVDRQGKKAALEEFAAKYEIPIRRTIAIGDGANDVSMLEAAGLGVSFNGKAAAREAADAALSVPYLDSVLYLLGITREDIEGADARAGVVTPAPRVQTN
ncbi:MAG: phosphoserine phosphatase SerB [Actinobacteria bacterium]|uniref:phosphoserine phosphatase n=1 Tax=freshwater metagenome TaxID=449393 RepID=A0A6J7A3H9_9ZZZZ|nr:phosphoserine phosphatase SerB [Actinomycetota bacterium]